MSDKVYVFTMNTGGKRGKWSWYQFPFIIEYFAHLRDTLYLRHGDTVSKVVEHEQYDNGVAFDSVIQWPWLDFKSPGRDKMMVGFDNVSDGIASIEIGFDQRNHDAFTTAFDLPADTVPGQIVPLPIMAPSFSVRLTYNSVQAWEWQALQLYVEDMDLGK